MEMISVTERWDSPAWRAGGGRRRSPGAGQSLDAVLFAIELTTRLTRSTCPILESGVCTPWRMNGGQDATVASLYGGHVGPVVLRSM
jgi:hypothetical protein